MRRPGQGPDAPRDPRERTEWVRWVDSAGDQDWTDDATGPDIGPVDTIGFVVEETDDKVVLVQSACEDGMRCHRIAIPKCSILGRWAIVRRGHDGRILGRGVAAGEQKPETNGGET
jgi:hypothetical protein